MLFNYESDCFEFGEYILITEVELQESLSEHSHDFLELAYIKSGKAWHIMNNEKSLIRQGDYVIVDYGVTHSFELMDGEPIEIVNCLFTPESIDISLKNCKGLNQVLNNYLITYVYYLNKDRSVFKFHDEKEEILHLIDKIKNELTGKTQGYMQIIRAYIIEIIIITMRKYQEINKQNLIYKKNDDIQFIIKFIEDNYEKQILVADLAQKLNLSMSYISRLFKKNTGHTISDHIQQVRVNHACRLLCNTNKKVSEIAFIVGYSDYKFFNEIFKKIAQNSPLQYKKIHCMRTHKGSQDQ